MDAETIRAIQYFRLGHCPDRESTENAEIIIKALQKAEWSAVETAWSFVDGKKK